MKERNTCFRGVTMAWLQHGDVEYRVYPRFWWKLELICYLSNALDDLKWPKESHCQFLVAPEADGVLAMSSQRDYSMATADVVDAEVRESLWRRLIQEPNKSSPLHIDILHRLAQLLIEKETVDGEEFMSPCSLMAKLSFLWHES